MNHGDQKAPEAPTTLSNEIDEDTGLAVVYMDENAPGGVNESSGDTTAPSQEEALKTVVCNAMLAHEILSQLPTEAWKETAVTLSIPSHEFNQLSDAYARMPNINTDAWSKGRLWGAVLKDGMAILPTNDVMTHVANDPNRQFVQAVQSESGPLAAHSPKQKAHSDSVLAGDAALTFIQQRHGLGIPINIPLWHTGVWVTIQAPTDAELLEMEREINQNKVTLGRQTYGGIFSNSSVYMANALVSLFRKKLWTTSLKEQDKLFQIIKNADLSYIAGYMAAAIYPRGFQFRRAIMNDRAEQIGISEGILNILKTFQVDYRALTPRQIAHMCKFQPASVTLKQVEDYQNDFVTVYQDRKVSVGNRNERRDQIDLGKGTYLTLSVPTLDTHLESGLRWVSEIVAACDEAFGMDQDPAERDAYITSQGQAAWLRQYCYYVKSIEASGKTIEDRETIEKVLTVLSADDDVRDDFIKAVAKFISDTTVAVMAIPAVSDQDLADADPKNPHIVVIDPLKTFFFLLTQKLETIRQTVWRHGQ